MAKAKKVMLVVVEGPTDETALGYLFDKLFSGERVTFDIVGGDTTTAILPAGGSAVNEVQRVIREHMCGQPYSWKDLGRIVQIVDLDGAFVGDDLVVPSSEGLEYRTDCIKTDDVERLRARNRTKSLALRKLVGTKELKYSGKGVPYEVYFMSRNLEHALHNVVESVDSKEKERLARLFRKRYAEDLEGFVRFMQSDEVAVAGDYRESWNAVREGALSLQRGSNLRILLERVASDSDGAV